MRIYTLALILLGVIVNAQTLLDESFEGPEFPAGWEIISTNDDPEYNWTFFSDYGDMEIYESNTNPQDEWLLTPFIDLSDYSEMYFTFSPWMYVPVAAQANDTFNFTVNVSTDGGNSWTKIWEEDEVMPYFLGNMFYNRTITKSLNEFCGPGMDNVRLGFHYTGNGGANGLSFVALLDVKVSMDCPRTSFSKITAAKVKWFPIENESFTGTFEIAYGPHNFEIPDGTLVTGLTGSSYTFPQPMTESFDILIRTNCGGSDVTDWERLYVNFAFLDVKENSSLNEISVYPNPTKDMLYFSQPLIEISVYDLSGKLIKIQKTLSEKLNVNDLTKGTYILSGVDKSGNRINQKFVKQ